MTNLLAILIMLAAQETRGEADPRRAIGDGGDALGRYQMHEGAVADVNAWFRPIVPYTPADRADPLRGELLAMGYAIILRTQYTRHFAREPSMRDYGRMWRFGFAGFIRSTS